MHKLFRTIATIQNSTIHNYQRNFNTYGVLYKAFLNRITVMGAGHMGTGIAQISANAGNVVTIADVNDEALKKSETKIKQRLYKFAKRLFKEDEEKAKADVETIMQRIKWTTDLTKSLENCDLLVEAIPENLELKQKMFAKFDMEANEDTIFVTNTSSIPVGEIAQPVSPSRKAKFGGVHFFEAVSVKLVEVIRIPETTDETFHKINEWSRFIGKVPVACKDTPGFIVNRLNIPFFTNAVRMYERGDASKEDIDIAMKLGAGYHFGPFEIADYIGIDVIYMILQGWEKRFPGVEQFIIPETIKQLYNEGKYGMKTGEGFFKY